MKKKIGTLLAAIMVLNTVSSVAYGFTNPLKSYNLYEDTHAVSSEDDGTRERVMDEFYSNSMSASNARPGAVPQEIPSMDSYMQGIQENIPRRRNDDLRESSRRVYGNPEVKAGWLEGPSFYQNPSFESIKAKYKKSDFAGCLQECISYVRLHPNDTLGFYYLAMCYSKVSDKENAIKAYEKVIELNANPMIVKYATNGRNCVMKSKNGSDSTNEFEDEMTPSEDESIKCYPNVNEPELIYPYANVANTVDLTPVDPQTLVNRNLKKLQERLIPKLDNEDESQSGQGKDKEDVKINLPFGEQDNDLDKFINAPYGNGLSPDLNKEYQQIQLKKLQQNINNGEDNPEKDNHNMQNIKNFDNKKTDAETVKVAYSEPSELENLKNNPEYVQYRKELEEIQMLMGNDYSNKSDDLMDLIPYLSDKDKKISPEAVEAMMMRSMMPDFSMVDTKNLL